MDKFWAALESPRPRQLFSRPGKKFLSLSLSMWCACMAAMMPVGAQPARPSAHGFVINGSQSGDFSGYSVSDAGDVNGDGLADVIVGALGADPDGRSSAGRSYVLFGRRNNKPVELSAIDSGTSKGGFVINGSNVYDGSGRSVSGAGDVNGDGLADVIVGSNTSPAGRSYVVFGKRNNKPVELSAIDSGTSKGGFVINGSNANDSSGNSVSGAGDVNGDGMVDLIVGAPFADPDGKTNAGRSYVVFGKRNNKPVELSAIESGTSSDGFVINGSNAMNYAGFSVSGAGDINGDGLADVIVGAYRADPNALYLAGRSYVVFGKKNSLPVELAAIETGTSSDGFVINGSNAFAGSGISVSGAGDVNGDGLADMIVGAIGASTPGGTYLGASYVIFGKSNTQPVELAAIESGTSSDGFAINGSNGYNFTGFSVSGAGDVNGDGLADVIVGAYVATPDGRSYAGRSYVVFGKSNTQPVELAAIESGTSPDGFVINGSNAFDSSGFSVSGAGDINGDGLADVIVGAWRATPDGRSYAGRSYVVFGKSNTQPVELSDLEATPVANRSGAGLSSYHPRSRLTSELFLRPLKKPYDSTRYPFAPRILPLPPVP